MGKWRTKEEKRGFKYDNNKRDAIHKEITTKNNDLKNKIKKDDREKYSVHGEMRNIIYKRTGKK